MFTFFLGKGQIPIINLTIEADVTNYNLFTAAGSPSYPVDVRVIIAAGVDVSSLATGIPSFTTGTGWNSNTSLLLTNNGEVLGRGGIGGDGGGNNTSCIAGTAGSVGGDALELLFDLSIDNLNGNIYGGGGGGGGGGGAFGVFLTISGTAGGGGGGGGQSGLTVVGGTGGSASGGVDNIAPGGVGSSGVYANEGAGDAGGIAFPADGGDGGDGGGWGEVGVTGSSGTGSVNACTGYVGGAAGKAVELTGNTITWLGGNTPSQVKGDVT